ncbi:putative enterotoxin [Ophiocordyceps camponoti-floridani]|uniref:Putative enterotoxin n=1 Tax=Ophiocordyceps camponoti-floridani TaxID=2030778 RepID=A0A8H4VEP4_9HYPO|nr:putative enterotoxin [Ophiocordyceps camponoti-floridani]
MQQWLLPLIVIILAKLGMCQVAKHDKVSPMIYMGPNMDEPLNRHWYDIVVDRHEPVMIVYRGDARGPSEVQAGSRPGFYPLNGPVRPQDYGLFSHVEGTLESTAYVSTTDHLLVAADYAHRKSKGKPGYIYRIQTSSNFVDVNRSLLNWRYRQNYEHVAMLGIPFSQVQAYVELTPEVYTNILQNRLKEMDWIVNQGHVPVVEKLRGSSVRPDLAGYPEGHNHWNWRPWRQILEDNGGRVPDLKAIFDKYVASDRDPVSSVRDGYDMKGMRKHSNEKLQMMTEQIESRAAKAFPRKARRFGLAPLASIQGKSWEAIRTALKNSPTLRSLASIGPALAKLPARAFYGAAIAALFKEFVDSLRNEASTYERASIVLAIVPILGCAAEAVANEVHGRRNWVGSALCLVGDVLMVTPAWPLGLALHILRGFLGSLKEKWVPYDGHHLQGKRAEAWALYLPTVMASLHDRRLYDFLEMRFQAEVTTIVHASSEAGALADEAALTTTEGGNLMSNKEAKSQNLTSLTNTTSSHVLVTNLTSFPGGARSWNMTWSVKMEARSQKLKSSTEEAGRKQKPTSSREQAGIRNPTSSAKEAKKHIDKETCIAIAELKKKLLLEWKEEVAGLVAKEAEAFDARFFEEAQTAMERMVMGEGRHHGEKYGQSFFVANFIARERRKKLLLFPSGRTELDAMMDEMASFYVSRRTARPCLDSFHDWKPPIRWYGTLGKRPDEMKIHGKPVPEEALRMAWTAVQLGDEKTQAVRRWARVNRVEAEEDEREEEKESAVLLRAINSRISSISFDVTLWARRNRRPKPDDWARALMEQLQQHHVNTKMAEQRARMDDEEDDEDEE